MSNAASMAAAQYQGDRPYQEDAAACRWLETDRGVFALLVLSDGMGGSVGGGLASMIAVDTVVDFIVQNRLMLPDDLDGFLQDALAAANRGIAEAVRARPALSGMGTTLVIALAAQGYLHWISVGDSPLWLIRGGQIYRVNEDHSMRPAYERRVQAGELTAEEAATARDRNVLRSVLMGGEIRLIDLPDRPIEISVDDCLILASDGLEALSPQDIIRIVEGSPYAAEVAIGILAGVREARIPKQDNATVVILQYPTPPVILNSNISQPSSTL